MFPITEDIELPIFVDEHPAVEELRLRANNVVCACDDILFVRRRKAPSGPLCVDPTFADAYLGWDISRNVVAPPP